MLRPRTLGPTLVVGLVALGGKLVSAQEQGSDLVDARNVGRAGASVVSGDSGLALVHNPAGVVRRAQSRVQLGLGIGDDDLEYSSEARGAPNIRNRAAPKAQPTLALHHGTNEGTWVFGVLLRSGATETALATPAFGQPTEDVERLFPHRYGGTAYRESWRQVAAGGAVRLGDSVGIGASFAIRDIEVREERRIWAGFDGRDRLLGAERDMHLALEGRDRFSPSASLGILYAPLEIPVEFAISTEMRSGPSLEGSNVRLEGTNSSEFPRARASDIAISQDMPNAAIVRTGLRYLGDRLFVEAEADIYLLAKESPGSWRVRGLSVEDESSAVADIVSVPTLHSDRSHLALRTAIDYEALRGFLWLTAGYAWHSPGTGENRRMPAYAELGGHRLALGLLAAHEDYSLSFGYSRRLQRNRSVDASTSLALAVNPFDAGSDASNAGRYSTSSDQLGFAIEVSW
ncbi:MAG: hypothetical protein GY811_27585 [Myxococcales bacterium]|nr:hypothetical protein [Myxococcales bacterium]